jgi:phosphate transport system protein
LLHIRIGVHDVRVRTKFVEELEALTGELGQMSRIAHEAVELATAAVTRADLAIAYEVFACDEQLKARHASCQQRALLLLALQAPVARDLRHVVTGSQIADNLWHMGSLAGQIAHYVYRHHPNPVVPDETVGLLVAMGQRCMALIDSATREISTRVWVDGSAQVISTREAPPDLATRAISTRDARPGAAAAVDSTHGQLIATVTDSGWAHGSAVAVDLALIGNCYVRFADHAERIEQLSTFFDTGIRTPTPEGG